jgi:DNA modification methylase
LLNKNSLSDVWRLVPTHQRKAQNHIAVMPDGIVQNILDAIPDKPNAVYDPFGGSGTTMKVCKQNDIDCIISEIDKEKENTILEKVGEKRKEKDLQAGTLFENEM